MASGISSVKEAVYQCVLRDPFLDEVTQKIQAIPKEERFQWSRAKLSRETIEFGLSYRHLEDGKRVELQMPEYIVKIRKILYEAFEGKILEGSRPEEFDNCIVSFYKPGDGMVPHIDRAVAGAKDGRERPYFFGDSILGLILIPDSKQSIYFLSPEEKEKIVVNEEKGMAYLFQSQVRQTWKHALDPIETGRLSVTFRKVNFK